MTHRSSFRRHIVIGCMLALLAAAPARADTLLHLGETATVMVAPDELAATLRIEIVTTAADEAQNRVNAVIRDALALARTNSAITVSTGGYSVWRVDPTPPDRAEKWRASQNLILSSKDGPALLTLVGDLQQKGMIVGNLGWRLSRDSFRKARQEATRQALAGLRGRIDEAGPEIRSFQGRAARQRRLRSRPASRAHGRGGDGPCRASRTGCGSGRHARQRNRPGGRRAGAALTRCPGHAATTPAGRARGSARS